MQKSPSHSEKTQCRVGQNLRDKVVLDVAVAYSSLRCGVGRQGAGRAISRGGFHAIWRPRPRWEARRRRPRYSTGQGIFRGRSKRIVL